MKLPARNAKQLGDSLARIRGLQDLTQTVLGEKAGLRQATISALENGEAGTRVQTLFDVLAALNLELVIQPRPDEDDVQKILEGFLEDMEK